MNWIDKALCKADENPHKWISYNYSDIEYAKSICVGCSVKIECAIAADSSGMYGVIAGLSEFDRLNLEWKEAKSLNESNWE